MNISFWLFCIYINAQIMMVKSLSSLTDRLACVGEKFCIEDSEYLNFILVGDIGGLPIYPYKSYAQVKVAKAMAILAQNKNTSFIINLGDNIYFNGVRNVFDARFKLSFEDVYNDPNLLMPWYTIAGNHDHLGNVSAQIAYTNYSDRWTFPNYYYKISYKIGSKNKTSIDIFMIDTVVLCGNPIEIHGSGVFDWIFAKHKIPSGPDDVEAANQQLHWLENQLENSHSDYLFVAGHYPIYSASGHGSLKCLTEKLDHLLRKYGVSAYFSGHDHDLQHIQVTGLNTNRTSLDYIIVGAGSRSDYSLKHRKSLPENSLLFNYPTGWNPFSQLGFSYGAFVNVEVRRERAEFTFYSGTLEDKYQMFILPRKINKM